MNVRVVAAAGITIFLVSSISAHGQQLKATCIDDNTEVINADGIHYLMVGDSASIRTIDKDTVVISFGENVGKASSKHFRVNYEQGMTLLANALSLKRYDGDKRRYDDADLQTTPEIDLFLHNSFGLRYADILRNEIFARHGDVFSKKFYHEIFLQTDWYRYNPKFNALEFNGFEQANIKWLKAGAGASISPSHSVDTANGLVAYYPFSGDANDASGNGLNGSVHGATLAEDRFGNADRCYYFDGVDDYIEVPYNPKLNITDALSISLWMKCSELPAYFRHLVNKARWYSSDGWDGNYWVAINPQAKWCFSFAPQGMNCLDHWNQQTIATGGWNHFVITFDEQRDSIKLYTNGTLDGAHHETMDMVCDTFSLWIAKSGHENDCFKGYLDDIRIYNKVLSQEEVNSLCHDSTAR